VSNILRHQLLENWSYPPLSEGLPGVNEFKGSGSYAGRIKSLSPFYLEWGGAGQEFSLSKSSFEPFGYGEVLAVGDLVAIEVSASEIIRLSLLAPAREQINSANYQWPKFMELVREYFVTHKFTEILTPALVDCPGTEPYLRPFAVDVKVNGKIQKKYLPTSPEINLKKFLARGHSRIFELKECFRNEEWTSHHRPEFLMLEWYRAFSNLNAIVEDLKSLVGFLGERLQLPVEEIQTTTVRELFHKHLDFDLKPDTTAAELAVLCERSKINFSAADSWDELFFRIFMTKIEPNLPATILKDYPPQLAAYSRIQDSGPSAGWADRFEFYWKGLEISNAFHELNDPRVQRRRMEDDNKRKIELGLEPVPLDEDFLKALAAGLPPSGGIALGVERLFMAFYNLKNISEVR
jgi:elongation factor P--(R)-beta-lysine ligase